MSSSATEHELHFIAKIGTFSDNTRRIMRSELLRKYIIAAGSRVDWGGIDRGKAVTFAESELAREIQKWEIKSFFTANGALAK